MEVVFIIHIVTSFFMAGLCWFVQIVHYPLFHQIKLAEFPNYERKNFVTGFITVPVMTIELVTGLYLVYHNTGLIELLNIALLGIIWLSTAIYQVPIHLKLVQTATTQLIDKLILTNWIRTISWSVRITLLSVLLYQSLIPT